MEKAQTMRQKQAQASKEKLQQIVFRLSQEKTLDEIRIKDICDEAEMSMGNFYLYFPSKESALIYSYKTKDDDWSTLGLEAIEEPLTRLCRTITTAIEECREKGLMNDKHSAFATAIRLLNFSRGLVYNYCIGHEENHDAWFKYAVECQQEYIQLFLTEKGKEYMEAAMGEMWKPMIK